MSSQTKPKKKRVAPHKAKDAWKDEGGKPRGKAAQSGPKKKYTAPSPAATPPGEVNHGYDDDDDDDDRHANGFDAGEMDGLALSSKSASSRHAPARAPVPGWPWVSAGPSPRLVCQCPRSPCVVCCYVLAHGCTHVRRS
jgi:hypothetical protein